MGSEITSVKNLCPTIRAFRSQIPSGQPQQVIAADAQEKRVFLAGYQCLVTMVITKATD